MVSSSCKYFFALVARKVLSPVLPTLSTHLSSVVCAVQLNLLLSASLSVQLELLRQDVIFFPGDFSPEENKGL